MKFSEKLQKLRKENNLSQEQLADKLDVSRQSVSKWESGQTYPEMDKLLTMCKLFNITLDDLTNDEVQYNDVKSKNKNSFDNLVDDVMYIIDKTFVMFSNLDARERGKVIGELIVLFIILLFFRLPFEYVMSLGRNVLYYLPTGVYFFQNLWSFIINVIYLILFVFTFLYIYKTYFLDKYKGVEKKKHLEEKNKQEEENHIEIKENQKEEKRVEKKHTKSYGIGATLFEILSKITSFCFKTFLVFISIPFIITFICIFICLVILIILLCKGIFYFGFLICCIAGIALNWLLLKIIASLLFNYKSNFKIMFTTFIIAISLTGIGTGLVIFDIASTDIINEAPETKFELITKSYEYNFDDNFVISNCNSYSYYGCYYYNKNYEYVTDENLTDKVEITISYYKDLLYIDSNEYNIDKYKVLEIWDNSTGYNKYLLDNILDNLKNKKIYNYEKLYEYKVVIKSSSNNINLLKRNKDEFNNYKHQYENSNLENFYENEIYKKNNTIDELYIKIDDLNREINTLRDENITLKDKIQNYKDTINNLD